MGRQQVVNVQSNGTVYNTLYRPAVVFDRTCGTVFKIGEYENMQEYLKRMFKTYKDNQLEYIMNDIILLELPLNQELINKVFNNTGYIKVYYEKYFK